jgi:hypothetical protein
MQAVEVFRRFQALGKPSLLVKQLGAKAKIGKSFFGGNWSHPSVPKCRMGCGMPEVPVLYLTHADAPEVAPPGQVFILSMCTQEDCREECFSAWTCLIAEKDVLGTLPKDCQPLTKQAIEVTRVTDYPEVDSFLSEVCGMEYSDVPEELRKKLNELRPGLTKAIKLKGHISWVQSPSHYERGRDKKALRCKKTTHLEAVAEFLVPGLERAGVLSVITCQSCTNQFTQFHCT